MIVLIIVIPTIIKTIHVYKNQESK